MNRIRLQGGLERTASSAYIDGEGRLVVECFDFSEDAHNFFGNDVAFVLTIAAELKQALLERLRVDASAESDADEALLRAVADRFSSYFDIKTWLEAEELAFTSSFDPHA
jgi:hypothetical protein